MSERLTQVQTLALSRLRDGWAARQHTAEHGRGSSGYALRVRLASPDGTHADYMPT